MSGEDQAVLSKSDNDSTPVPSQQQVPQVTLILKPMNEGWSMGEDWEIARPLSSTMYDLRVLIEETRGINRHRIMLRVKGKIFPPARDKWTFRRLGLYDGFVIQVEPTMSGTWWWHPKQHYIDKFIKELEDFLDQQPEKGIFLTEMIPQISIPPPIKQSLRIFLRMYPDHFNIYYDVRKNTMWIRRTQSVLQLPIFERFPHYLGNIKQFELPDFNWEDYKDIDDKYATEEFVSEEQLQEIAAAKEKAEKEAWDAENPPLLNVNEEGSGKSQVLNENEDDVGSGKSLVHPDNDSK